MSITSQFRIVSSHTGQASLPDTSLSRHLIMRVTLWSVFATGVAGFVVWLMVPPALLPWIVALCPAWIAGIMALMLFLIVWLNYRDIRLRGGRTLNRFGRYLGAPAIGSILTLALYILQTFIDPHYSVLRLDGIDILSTIALCGGVLAGAGCVLNGLFRKDKRRTVMLALHFFAMAVVAILAPIILIQEKDTIHFLLARPVYDYQLHHMMSADARFHVWDWGHIDSIVLNTEGTSLVFDAGDQLARPANKRTTDWIATCEVRSNFCRPYQEDQARVQRLGGHYYLVVTPY